MEITGDKDTQVAVEMLQLKGESKKTLVAFVVSGSTDQPKLRSKEQLQIVVDCMTDGIDEQLATHIPSYMIPSYYILIQKLPRTTMGKTDRRALCKSGESLCVVDLTPDRVSKGIKEPPASVAERQLRDLWAYILQVPPGEIGVNDSFLRLGGHSVSAMRLATAARSQDILPTVADVLRTPGLVELARLIKNFVNGIIQRRRTYLLHASSSHRRREGYATPGCLSVQCR